MGIGNVKKHERSGCSRVDYYYIACRMPYHVVNGLALKEDGP